MKRRTAVAGAALAALLAVALTVPALSSGSSSDRKLSRSQILSIARAAARRAGDRAPLLIEYAEGTRHAANLVASGDIVPGNEDSFLIVVLGKFVLKDAPVPLGAMPPRGQVMTLIVNARTGRATDGGVSNQLPDLATLGRVTVDYAAHKQLGALTGRIEFALGPAQTRRQRFAAIATVAAVRGGLTARESVRAGKTFRFLLPPGTYRAQAHPAGRGVADCAVESIRVRAGRTTPVTLSLGCSIPY